MLKGLTGRQRKDLQQSLMEEIIDCSQKYDHAEQYSDSDREKGYYYGYYVALVTAYMKIESILNTGKIEEPWITKKS